MAEGQSATSHAYINLAETPGLKAPTRSRVPTPTHASRHKLQLAAVEQPRAACINSLHLAVVNAASKRHVVQEAAGDKQIDLRARTPRFAVEPFDLAAVDAMLTFPAARIHGELRRYMQSSFHL